jgi:hypothetical protein
MHLGQTASYQCVANSETFDLTLLYLLTAIGLTPGGSSTVLIYTQTILRTTQLTILLEGFLEFEPRVVKLKMNDALTPSNFHLIRKGAAVPRLCELYPGIYLTTEEKHGKTSVRLAEDCQLAR